LGTCIQFAEGATVNLNLNITAPVKYIAPKYLKENATNIVRLGVVAVPDPPDSRFGYQLTAIQVAVDWVNSNPDLLPDTALEIYSATSQVESDVLFTSAYLATNIRINGFIGAGFTPLTKQMQTVASIYKIPQMSASVVTNALSNKINYPFFARTVTTDTAQINGLIAFFQDNNWTQGVVVYTNDEYGSGYSPLVLAASKANISLYSQPVDALATNLAPVYKKDMDSLKALCDERGYRIFILYTSQATNAIVSAMNISGLFGPGYVLIETGGPADGARNPNTKPNALLDGVFGFGYGMPGGTVYDEINNYWKSRNVTQNTSAAYNLWYYIDIVLAYANAFDYLLKNGTAFSNISGTMLFTQIMQQNFTGTTGLVQLDSNGDRIGSYEVWNWLSNQTVPAGLRHVGHWDVGTQTYTKLGNYTFFNNSVVVPRDRPYLCPACQHGICVVDKGCVCDKDYSGSLCDVYTKAKKEDKTTIIIIPVVVVVVALIILSIGAWVYRRNKRQLVRSVAEKQKSVIPRGDLVLNERIGRGASGEVCKGLFRGTEIAVKRIITSNVNKSVIEAFELEVAVMCGLRHPNIIMFMGSCYDPNSQEMLLCMEYMGRGSLNDVLHNSNINLSYEMKLHLAAQAAQGMNFLHQSTPPTIHRDLKSHNILLDDKWNARISDFGISKFKEDTQSARTEEATSHMVGTIYWSAPEVLAGKEANEKCDCYSFGIVIWELFHRDIPYKGRDPMSVAMEVIRGGRPAIDGSMPPQMEALMKACWAQNPAERPSFQEIMTTLRTLSLQAPLVDYGGSVRMDAPTGHVYIVTTTIPHAYQLWEAIPRDMEEAVKLHNQVIRHNLGLYKGYEVSFYDHSFTTGFAALEDAINFAIAVQISLLHVDWPKALLSQPFAQEVVNETNGTVIWKGLRVRMAVGSGVPNCEIDPGTNRMQYFGPVVDQIMKILEIPMEGCILLNDACSGELMRKSSHLIQEASPHKVTTVAGIAVHQLVIHSLSDRGGKKEFLSPDEPSLPHAVVTIDELEEETLTPHHSDTLGESFRPASPPAVKWLAKSTDIEIKEVIGKGPIGDYYRGYWKGQEVAVKVLVNQKLKEPDVLKLIGDSAWISKLHHNNILPFYAICLEQEKLTILSEYESKGNLKHLLADSSTQLTLSRKVKLALGLAQGMAYLTSLPDAALSKHDNLKSGNVLIGKDGEVKVADYGHSNIKEIARTMTSVGNVAWTAPEILSGQEGSPKMAVYSFGIILWELYTRQIPYKNEHPIRVVSQILSGYRPPLSSDCPPAYRQLYEQCVVEDPDKRPSWDAIISALNKIA
jgi:serine/threonine protein kinase